MKKSKYGWNRQKIMELRRHLGVTQCEMAKSLGTRQQTISEWELGTYRPRGMSVTLLNYIAETCNFKYSTSDKKRRTGNK